MSQTKYLERLGQTVEYVVSVERRVTNRFKVQQWEVIAVDENRKPEYGYGENCEILEIEKSEVFKQLSGSLNIVDLALVVNGYSVASVLKPNAHEPSPCDA
jgi:hypothetical protein